MVDEARDRHFMRERIMDASLRLFIESGYRATSVADIEAAVNLTPRERMFYRYFANKKEVLGAIIDRRAMQLDTMDSLMDQLSLGDLRAELTLIARWFMHLTQEVALLEVLLKEGENLPDLVEQVRQRIVVRGYQHAAEWLRGKMERGELPERDPHAVAAVSLGALVNYRLEQVMFGTPPASVDEEKFIETWVDVWEKLGEIE